MVVRELTMLSGTSAGEAWSLQRSRTTSVGGGVLTVPGDAPASPPATTTLNTHAILLGASSLTLAAVRRWRFYVPVQKKFLPVLPTGLWTLVAGARAAGEPVVPPGML